MFSVAFPLYTYSPCILYGMIGMCEPGAWVKVRVINIYTGFLRCFPRMVHWVMSAEFDVSFARGFLCCVLFPRSTERFVACGFLYGSEILEDGCRLGFCASR